MPSAEVEFVNELLRSAPFGAMTLEEQRAAVERAGDSIQSGTSVSSVDGGGVPCEWVTSPTASSSATVLALRGGGYCLGSLASNRQFCSLISEAAATRVLNVGYRSAPEHRFPAALDDAVAAYRWLVRLGVAPSEVALAGNSAGGGLVLATLLALRDAGDPLPRCAVAISPWTDLAVTGGSMVTNAATEVMLDPIGIPDTAALYADRAELTNPYVSPLYGDLRGLPPILLHVSSSEVLLDDATRFAAKARAAGVDVTLEVVEGMPHVWHLFAGLLPEADDALERIGRWVTAQFASASVKTHPH